MWIWSDMRIEFGYKELNPIRKSVKKFIKEELNKNSKKG